MSFSFWSDEDRLFVPRMLGWSINFKFIAKKLGWIRSTVVDAPQQNEEGPRSVEPESREDRLKRAVERSRTEDG